MLLNGKTLSTECIKFTGSIIELLNAKGFHIGTPLEAYYCIQTMAENINAIEIRQVTEESPCRDCTSLSGLKSTDPEN